MARGRKKSPVTVKATRGTLRADRMPKNMPEPSKESMSPSLPLDDKVNGYFEFLRGIVRGMGNDSSSFGPALSLAALRMAEVDECTADILKDGSYYTSEDGKGKVMKRPHPAIARRSEAMRHLQSLLAEFGLTPAAIQKVGGGEKSTDNPFGEFK